MSESAVRRRVVQLMIWRLVITTILLGSAAAIQFNTAASAQPGPLYVLIAWTYALSAGYALSLRLTRRAPWLVDVQLALDALTVAGFVWVTGGILSYFSFIYVLPIMAASAVHFRRGALRITALSMLLYTATAAAQYSQAPFQPWSVWEPGTALSLPRGLVAEYTVAVHLLGFLAVGLLTGSLAERVRNGRRATGRRIDGHRQPAGVQRPHHRQPDDGAGHDRPRGPHPDVQPGGRDHYRALAERRRRAGRPPACLGLPPDFAAGARSGTAPAGQPAGRLPVPAAGRKRDRPRPQRHHARNLRRHVRVPVHVPGRHHDPAARARRPHATAAGGGGRDGGGDRPRDPQPAGFDLRLDADPAEGAVAQRRAVAADGHRAAGIRAAEPDHQQLPGLRAPAALRHRAPRPAAGAARRRPAVAEQRRGEAGPRRRRGRAAAACLVRGRRGPGAAGRLEPGDERPAGDAQRRPPAPRCAPRAGERGRRARGAG